MFTVLSLCLFVISVRCQPFDEIDDPRVQEINYAKQFEHGHNTEHASDQASSDPVNDNPLLRELFKEFLAQYQQIMAEHSTQAPNVALTTTTTTEGPLKVQVPTFPSFHQENSNRPIKPTTTVPQKRRLSSSRKSNNPEAIKPATTTPFSTLINIPHNQPAGVLSLKQKYFGINTQTHTKRPPLKLPTPTNKSQQLAEPASKFQLLQSKLKATTKSPPSSTSKPDSAFDEEEFRRQAESAKYEFASDINDEINGNVHQREEIRDGLTVKGKYSYSDGYFKRTVHYEADDKGYRVVKEEVESLGGPQANPDGRAKVSSYVDGNTVNYQITKDDIRVKNQKLVFDEIDDLEDDGEEN